MANQGFVRTLNLDEVTDGAKTIQNLAGGTVDADLRVFAGLSSERSQLLWNRFINRSEINQSVASLKNGTQLIWDTNYTYTDDDFVFIEPVNLLRDFDASYSGFDEGGIVVSDPLGAADFNFDIGEGYTQGTYNNVALSGGTGSNAKANIVINSAGAIASVQITDNGSGYSYGDKLLIGDGSGGDGVGFVIRITAFPWEATAVGNFAWSIEELDNLNLRITYDNCSSTLDGTYTIAKGASNKNIWGVPNNAVNLAYDVNRQITVQEKINNNLDIYDIDGDGSITVQDMTYMQMFVNGDDELAFTTYIQNNPVNAGSTRQTGPAIYRYIDGLAPSVLDVDGTGLPANATDISLINSYVTGGGVIYTRKDAPSLATGRQAYSAALKHAISVTCKVPANPGTKASLGIGDVYDPPYFFIEKYESNEWKNVYDNFSKYGTSQTCTTSEADYISASIGITKTEGTIKYTIVDKFVVFDGAQNNYFVRIVASGTGFTNGQTFSQNPTLTASTGVPVFNKNSEYGIFDSDGAGKFYLRTNPRSSVESIKEMVLFAEVYNLSTSESTQYGGTQVPTTTLIPDLVLKRDDSLTLSNIQNLETPEIIDDGENKYSSGFDAFNYGAVSQDGYAGTLANVTDNVDESIYLRSTKYRIDRSLYFMKEIKFNGFITSYDPDELNITQTDLLTDLSPGIYISSSLSQITNPLASDYANKTRSFSSDFNPWTAFTAASKLATQSLNVTINDLVWTTEIEFDINTSVANGTRFTSSSDLNQTLGDNFAISESNPTSFKLKITINGEVFYLMMKKS